jgi:hypothetical protein
MSGSLQAASPKADVSVSAREKLAGLPPFTIGGVMFDSYWIGDNSGHYEWRSADGRRKAGRNTGSGTFWATCEGRPQGSRFLTLNLAMIAAAKARLAA